MTMKKVGAVWLTICKYGFIQITTLAIMMKKYGAVWLTICKYGFIQITTLAITMKKYGAVWLQFVNIDSYKLRRLQ